MLFFGMYIIKYEPAVIQADTARYNNNSISNGFYLNNNNNNNNVNGGELLPYNDNIENELILYDIENWTCGSQEMFIRLENEFGEEKACFRKTN